jgi:hypothetical protein
MQTRSRLKDSEHRIGGHVYFLTRVPGSKSKWVLSGNSGGKRPRTFASHAAAIRHIQGIKIDQAVPNRLVFNKDVAERTTQEHQPKLVRSLPPTEGTGLPDTRPLMPQAREDLSDNDLVYLLRDRGLIPELVDTYESEVRECLVEQPITIERLTDLSLDALVADQKNGRGAKDFCQWVDDAKREDVREALTELDFSLSELASLVEQAVGATCPGDVREAVGKYLDSDIGAAPDMTFAYLAREATTLEDKKYYVEQFTKEVMRG